MPRYLVEKYEKGCIIYPEATVRFIVGVRTGPFNYDTFTQMGVEKMPQHTLGNKISSRWVNEYGEEDHTFNRILDKLDLPLSNSDLPVLPNETLAQ